MRAEDADLPLLAHDDPALAGERFHEVLDDLASRSWLARSDLGYLVLGREPGMALLKDRRLSFPAVELLELQGLTDGVIYDGTTKGLMAQSGQPHARLRFGAHFCAGASLARAEIIEALAFLAPRMRHLELDGEPVFGTPAGIYTMRSLPVRFTPDEPG
jgi:hypothetical protein